MMYIIIPYSFDIYYNATPSNFLILSCLCSFIASGIRSEKDSMHINTKNTKVKFQEISDTNPI